MDELRQLVLSKWLFTRGRDTLRGAGPFDPGLAVSLFQDAAELALAALAQLYKADLSKRQIAFFGWWDLLTNAPGREGRPIPSNAGLRQLNDARVSFKHFGRCPRRDEALAHQANCEQFLVEVVAIVGHDFQRLSLASLVQAASLRDTLIEAERLIEAGEIRAATERCADIQVGIDKLQERLTRIPIRVSLPSGTPSELKRYVDDNVSDMRRGIGRAIGIALSGHFGVNPIQFAVMREELPTKQAGSYAHSVAPERITPAKVRGWIDLQTSYILALTDAMAVLNPQ